MTNSVIRSSEIINAYCQDNIISWLDWNRFDKFHEVFDFVKDLIAFRNLHPIIRKNTSVCSLGYPCMSIHNSFPHNQEFRDDTHVIGILFAGRNDADEDDLVFLAINAHWEQQPMQLPDIPNETFWNVEFFTNALYESGKDYHSVIQRNDNTFFHFPPRTVIFSRHEERGIGLRKPSLPCLQCRGWIFAYNLHEFWQGNFIFETSEKGGEKGYFSRLQIIDY